jgi:hypothetical protein
MFKRVRLTRSEITSILVASAVLAFVISLVKTTQVFLYSLVVVFLILIINTAGKKFSAYYYDTKLEIKLWELKKYGFRAHYYFKKPFPAGVIFPIMTTALSLGTLKWLACLVFDSKTPVYKAARRHDKFDYNFSETTEWQTGVIATWGLAANLIAALIAIKLGYPDFAKLSIFYMVSNIIPFSDLDGNKMLFAHWLLWVVSAVIILGATIIAIIV